MRSEKQTNTIIRTEAVSRYYADGNVQALRQVSISIRRGEYVAVMGPSGSGKSTLLNVIGALDRPSGGEVYFEGQPPPRAVPVDQLAGRPEAFPRGRGAVLRAFPFSGSACL